MTAYTDAFGDTFGFSDTQPDIEQVKGVVIDGNLVISIDFFTPIAAPSTFLPEAVFGLIDLDLDQDASTGFPSYQSIFSPFGQQGGALGSEIIIDLFSQQFNIGTVNLLNSADFSIIGQASISYGSDSLQIQLPLSLLGDDGALNFSTLVGTAFEPTDAAPDTAIAITSAASLESNPNDTLATAINLALNPNQDGVYSIVDAIGNNPNVALGLDVDFFQVQLGASDQISIDIDANQFGGSLDSVVRLFDANGTQLAASNDASAPGEFGSLDAFLDFTATAAGTYYIGISGYSNFNYDPLIGGSGVLASTGDYSLDIAVLRTTEVTGTTDDDVLLGTGGRDLISGLAGDDSIIALGGGDRIFGGAGDDLITAGAGNDTSAGGDDDDLLYGDAGNDTLSGDAGVDLVFGGEGNDLISGGLGKDRLFGDVGNDQLSGDDGNDVIDAGDGDDTVFGGLGKDRIFGGAGVDYLYGEAGNDRINGHTGSDSLEGGDGNDRLYGGADRDTLNGGAGRDQLVGVDSASFGFTDGIDVLTGGDGQDTFYLGDANRTYYQDGDATTTGEFDYALITDFSSQDTIQLHGDVSSYSLDFYTSSLGSIDAALIYDDPTQIARAEVIGILQNVSTTLSLTDSSFTFVV